MKLKKSVKFLGVLVSVFLLAPNALMAASKGEMMQKIDMLQSQIDDLRSQLTSVEAKTDMVAESKGVDVTPGSVASRVKAFFSKSEIHALADAGYLFNTTSDEPLPLGVLQSDDNDFSANAEIVFENAAEQLWDVGFRTDIHFGTDIAEAISGDDDFDFEQVYVEAIVPFFDEEVKLTFGKFITHIGWELIPGYDAVNENITRSIAFGFAIPFTHTGLKATYQINENAEFTLIGTNGWDNVDDNNNAKSIGTQLIVNLTDNLTLYANGIVGPEQDDDNDDWRYLANLILEYAFNDQLTFVVNGVYGHEDDVDTITTVPAIVSTTVAGVTALDVATVDIVTEDDADWGAISAYARYQVNDRWALTTRSEIFFDEDGSRTGVEQDVWEITQTIEYAINDDARVRLEGRYDHSDEDFFDGEDDQFIVALNAQLRF